MPIHKVKLLPDANGNQQEVILNSDISLGMMRKLKSEGLISKTFLNDMVKVENDPSLMNFDEMANAPYIAYRNANPNGMTQEAFEDRFPNDMELQGLLYGEIVSGESKKAELANAFSNAAKQSGKSSGKKNRKRSFQK